MKTSKYYSFSEKQNPEKSGNIFVNIGKTFKNGDVLTKLSFFIFGIGNIFRGQIIKGLLFLAAEFAFI